MPRFEFDTKIGFATLVSVLTLLTVVFGFGAAWRELNAAQEQQRKEIDQVRVEMNLLRAYDTSIALLNRDVKYITESVNRIEQRIMKLAN